MGSEVSATAKATHSSSEKSNSKPGVSLGLSENDRKTVASLLGTLVTWRTLSLIHACTHCGLCTDACHYYVASGDRSLIPINKLEKVSLILQKYHVIVGSKTPWFRTRQLSDEEAEDLYRVSFEQCSLCGKCGIACPIGINAGPIFLTVRSLFARIGKVPSGLDEPVETAVQTGNYIGFSDEDFSETIDWIAEEISDEPGFEDFTIPVDKEGTDILYVPHALELRDNPLLLTAALKILAAASENYTLSSSHFDVVNYAYYSGHTDYMLQIVRHLLHGKEKINAQNIALTPCGHGYRVLRWEAERQLGYRFPFRVFTFSELIDRYLREGRLRLKKDMVGGPITYHDPCNIGRYGGVIQEPRNILRTLSSDFVEMEPSGVWNYCCGGGGGLAATGDYGQLRMKVGKVKADQIRKTGAKVVVTNCYNCMTQIRELNDKYKLGVKVKSIVELVADSLDT